VEPFPGNPRDVVFPLTRTWTRETGGTLASQVEFMRASPLAEEYAYVMRAGGTVIERGTAGIEQLVQPATIDFRDTSGVTRLGVWDIVSGRMQLNYGEPGATRPGQPRRIDLPVAVGASGASWPVAHDVT